MDDRFLCRGKRIDNGDLVEGFFVEDETSSPGEVFMNRSSGEIIGYTQFKIPCIMEHKLGNWYEVDPDTIGRCTGLKDKNGKLIFEGDIIDSKCHMNVKNGFYTIYFEPYLCRFVLCKDDKVTEYDLCGDSAKCYVVIGNIYENPELLEGNNSENN